MRKGAYNANNGGALSWAVPGGIAMLLLCALTFVHTMPAADDKDITAVFAPGTTFSEALTRINQAGGEVLSIGASDNILIARFEEGWNHDVLAEVGVWLVLSANFDSACTTNNGRRQTPLSQPI